MAKDVYIVAVPPTGRVTQLGSDHGPGIWVEDVSWDHSLPDKGARQCQFTLRRKPEQEWPDLQPFTPLIAHKDGSVTWSGRVLQTPTIRGRENEITVIGEGWPAHLKDDAVEKWFVHNDLTAWRDVRAFPVTNLAVYTGSYQVDLGGAITIRVPNGTTVILGAIGAVTLDAGPLNKIKKAIVTYIGGGHAGFALKWYAGDTPTAATESGTIDALPIATISTAFGFTMTTPRQYLTVYMDVNVLTNVVLDTAWVKLTDILCVTDTAYEGGAVSILKANQVISAVLPYAPKVSQSTLGITATSFSIPHFAGPVTSPGDYIDAVNDFHGYQTFLRDGADGGAPRLIFRPVPTQPTIVANVGAGIEFNDASRNDGSEIYNRCIVEYTDAAGNPGRAERTTAGLDTVFADPDITYDTISNVQPVNGGFETAGGPPPTGWTLALGAFARDVVVFDTGVASGLVTSSAAGAFSFSNALTGTPLRGRRSILQWRIRKLAAWTSGDGVLTITDQTGAFITSTVLGQSTLANNVWTSSSLPFVVPPTATALSISIVNSSAAPLSTALFNLDGFTVVDSRPTIIDKQSFVRTKVLTTGSRLTAAAANQIGDVFLQAHRFTPLRGTLTIQGSSLRTLIGDVPIPAHLVGGRYLGDVVLINETDPDLGTIGRTGILASAAYQEASDTVTCGIDNNRDFIAQLMSRLGIFLPS